MRQVFQDLKTGETRLAEVPRPSAGPGQVLIRSHASLVSAGTERMLVEFGKAGFIDKARQQPDKVRQMIAMIRTDGLKCRPASEYGPQGPQAAWRSSAGLIRHSAGMPSPWCRRQIILSVSGRLRLRIS